MSHLVPYLIIPDDASEAVYAAVRDEAADGIDQRLIQEGFEPVREIPGWSAGNGWHFLMRRLFTVEAE